METIPVPITPPIPTPETRNYEPLPAIVIPEKVAREIKSARKTVARHVSTAKAVILLERSAPVLYEAVRPVQADRAKEIRISIGTEINRRYQASHPGANLQIAGTDRTPQEQGAALADYSAWLDADPTVQQIIEDLARQLSSLHLSPGDEIVCLDDIVESGITAFTAAHILHKAQERAGLPGKVMFQGSKAIRAAIDADTEREPNMSETALMFGLLKNFNWLHDIVDESFPSIVFLPDDPSRQELVIHDFLYKCMKGATKNMQGVIAPLGDWQAYIDLGTSLASPTERRKLEPESSTVVNPALVLEARFGRAQIMSIHERLVEALKEV